MVVGAVVELVRAAVGPCLHARHLRKVGRHSGALAHARRQRLTMAASRKRDALATNAPLAMQDCC